MSDVPPFDELDDEALANHTVISRRPGLPTDTTVMVSRRPAPLGGAPVSRQPGPSKPSSDTAQPTDADDDDAFPDRTRMVSRRPGPAPDAMLASHQSGPSTDGTIVVARRPGLSADSTVVRQSGPSTDGTIVVARRPGLSADSTVVRQSGPSTDGTIVVARRPGQPAGQSGPPTDGTVVVRRGGRPGAGMADPVLRDGQARPTSVPRPPRSTPEERPRYTPRAVAPPPGPPLPIMEGPTALRGTVPLPSVAAAGRRTARVALAVWLVLSLVCAAGAVWCATELFGG